jgi:hypothetical protein
LRTNPAVTLCDVAFLCNQGDVAGCSNWQPSAIPTGLTSPELGIADRNHAIAFDQKGFLLGEQRFLLGQGPLERSYIVGGIGSSACHRNNANQSAYRTLMNPC